MDDQVDVDFFEKALAEEGLTGAEVTHYREPANMCEVIRVQKTVNGERVGYDHQISDREIMQIDNLKQHMAMLAGQTARYFEDKLQETHEWGEKAVVLDLNEDYSATCYRCGTEVSMDDLDRTTISMAETATPRPALSSYEMLSTPKLRMTLLALLKGECDPFCPNSPMDEKNVRFDRKV